MSHLNRRVFLSAAASCAISPALAQTTTWDDVTALARGFDQCNGLLILRQSETKVSQVFRGPDISRLVPIKSVSKSIVAALTGAALDRGELGSLNATIGDVAPNLIPNSADPRVRDITIEHLVTMQAGLERTSGANYGGWVSSSNWVANALSRPFVAEPGEQMLYSTGSFHVLGAVLSEISGESLLSLARTRLGRPLGIEIPAWTRDPQGRYLGGNEMALTLPAMARFGEMYRNGGRWNGSQILGEDWVNSSFTPITRSPFSGLNYGYGWFLGRAETTSYALARGYGGQIICIVPDLDLTIAITSDPTRPARSGGYFGDLQRLITDAIIPTAQAESA